MPNFVVNLLSLLANITVINTCKHKLYFSSLFLSNFFLSEFPNFSGNFPETLLWKLSKFPETFLETTGNCLEVSNPNFEFRSNQHIHHYPQQYCFDCCNCLHSHIDLYKVGTISCSCKSCSCISWYIHTCGEPEELQGQVEQCSALNVAVCLFQSRKNQLSEEYWDKAWLTFFEPGHANMPFLYEVPMYPLLVSIASLLGRTWQIRPTWGQLVTRTNCWLVCREDRHTFLLIWKYRLIHVGHYQRQQKHNVVDACKNGL